MFRWWNLSLESLCSIALDRTLRFDRTPDLETYTTNSDRIFMSFSINQPCMAHRESIIFILSQGYSFGLSPDQLLQWVIHDVIFSQALRVPFCSLWVPLWDWPKGLFVAFGNFGNSEQACTACRPRCRQLWPSTIVRGSNLLREKAATSCLQEVE